MKSMFFSDVVKRIFRIAFRIILVFNLFLLLLWFLLQLSPVQNFIFTKAAGYYKNETGHNLTFSFVGLTLPAGFEIDDLYVEDNNNDTLLYCRKLTTGISFLKLISGNIDLGEVSVQGLNCRIIKYENDSVFNFSYIVDSFSSNKKADESPEEKSSIQLSASNINLRDIKFVFKNEASQMTFATEFDVLYIPVKEIDLNSNVYKTGSIAIENCNSLLEIGKASEDKQNESASLLPEINIEEIQIINTNFIYKNNPDSSIMKISSGNIDIVPLITDLNTSRYEFRSVIINNASYLSENKAHLEKNTSSDSTTAIIHRLADIIPVSVRLDELKITKSNISIRNGLPLSQKYFDPGNFYMFLSNVDLGKVQVDTGMVFLKVNSIALEDSSGIAIKNLQASVGLTSGTAFIKDFKMLTPASDVRFSMNAQFDDLNSIKEQPTKTNFIFSMNKSTFNINEIKKVSKSLSDNKDLSKFKNFICSAELNGGGGDVHIHDFSAGISDRSGIDLKGEVKNISNLDSIYLNIDVNRFAFDVNDLNGLTAGVNFKLPEDLKGGGNIKGTIRDLDFFLTVLSNDGNVSTFGNIKNALTKDIDASAFVALKKINAGHLLNNSELGLISANTEVNALISDSRIFADGEFDIHEFGYNNYIYKDIKGDLAIRDKLNSIKISSADKNLKFALNAEINLDENAPAFIVDFDLAGADLKKLNLSDRDLRVSGKTTANINGKITSDPQGTIKFENFKVIESNELYHIPEVEIIAALNDSNHTLDLISDPITFHLSSSAPFDSMAVALQSFYSSQAGDSIFSDSTTSGAVVAFDLNINDSKLLTNLLVPGLNRLEPGAVSGFVNTFNNTFEVNAGFPAINYSNMVIDSLYLNISNTKSVLDIDLLIASINYDKYDLNRVQIKSDYVDSRMLTQLSIGNENDLKVFIPIEISNADKVLIVKLKDNVIFNNQKWNTGIDNYMSLDGKNIKAHNFVISNSGEQIALTGSNDLNTSDLKLQFQKFQLENVGNIISADSLTSFITGELSGSIDISNYINKKEEILKIEVKQLAVDSVDVGDLDVNAFFKDENLNFSANITGKANELYFEGSVDSSFSHYNLDADIRKFSLKTLLPFAVQTIYNADGFIDGKLLIGNQNDKMDVEGEISFNGVDILTSYTDSYLKMDQQSILFLDQTVKFKKFTIQDTKGASMQLTGNINYSDLSNPGFDLSVKSKGFELYNKAYSKKDVYYGKLILDSDISVKGDLDFPVIRADIKVGEGSRLGFVVPDSQSDVENFDKDVIFVKNESDSNNIMLLNNDTVLLGKTFGGMDLTSNIELNDKSELVIHVDQESGDSLTVSGDAVLSFNIDEGGAMSLTGSYQVTAGSYLLSFQNLVKKRFNLKRGGTINWTGEVLDADINLEAIHTVSAAPLELVSDQVGGLSDADLNAYRQRLPFEILLKMTGNILQPQIEFKIDLPPEEQDALNGTVYAKLNIINSDESQVNKQVFALLVLNRFIGDDIFKSESGDGGESLARNSASKILSQQLNNLSAQYIKGVELSFDIQSYNDFSNGEQQGKTEVGVGVKKRFLKNRLIVQVNGNVDVEGKYSQQNDYSNIAGDLILEYILTKDGRYKLRAFRKDQYQGIIDGEVRETGGGIIYTRNFNNWSELFKSPDPKE